MTIRTDVTVDWSLSPRIITVLAPSTAINIQDLHDTLVELEGRWSGIDEPRIVSTAGKEFLAVGVSVGLTMTLLNAKLAFEARPGPSFVQCNVDGGNLVAVDVDGTTPIDPIQTTAYTQVVKTSSSSATLLDQENQQAAVYQGQVAWDPTSSNSGTNFPTGTREFPVNNLTDAQLIADSRGLHTIAVISDATIATEDLSKGYLLIGDSISTVTLMINSAADVSNCTFENFNIGGATFDPGVTIRGCHALSGFTFIGMTFSLCLLDGVFVNAGTDPVNVLDCWSGDPGSGVGRYPIFDFANLDADLVVRGWEGGLGVRNVSDAGQELSFDYSSGRLTVESTVTAGTVNVRGICDLNDESTGSAVVLNNTLSKKIDDLIKGQFNKMVTDPGAGTITVYDDDDVTVLKVADLYEDAAGTQPYRGQGAERRERMT
mgnify:CR=1 FL=1